MATMASELLKPAVSRAFQPDPTGAIPPNTTKVITVEGSELRILFNTSNDHNVSAFVTKNWA